MAFQGADGLIHKDPPAGAPPSGAGTNPSSAAGRPVKIFVGEEDRRRWRTARLGVPAGAVPGQWQSAGRPSASAPGRPALRRPHGAPTARGTPGPGVPGRTIPARGGLEFHGRQHAGCPAADTVTGAEPGGTAVRAGGTPAGSSLETAAPKAAACCWDATREPRPRRAWDHQRGSKPRRRPRRQRPWLRLLPGRAP